MWDYIYAIIAVIFSMAGIIGYAILWGIYWDTPLGDMPMWVAYLMFK